MYAWCLLSGDGNPPGFNPVFNTFSGRTAIGRARLLRNGQTTLSPVCYPSSGRTLRRRSSTLPEHKWYHLIRWQTERDAFEEGAWFHGRIYEERCDLSPDGSLFVYFCHGGALRPRYTDAWTALSRAPWLYALGLWPRGSTWGGGGRFLDNRRLKLHVNMRVATHPDHPATGLKILEGDAEYHRSTGEVEGADWCGHDHQGHLVYCRGGKLFRHGKGRDGQDKELADFNSLRPNPRPAPDWAKHSIG